MKCYNCGYGWIYDFMEECPQCNAYVRCCKNCENFAPSVPNFCKQGFLEYNRVTKNQCSGFKENTRLF